MILNIEQGTPRWIDLRYGKIGSSDVPVILGKSPYTTPLQLWQRKTGLIGEQADNPAMSNGRELEPIVRAMVIKELGLEFEPTVFQSDIDHYSIASLDGWNEQERMFIEIKAPGKYTHMMAVNGEIPEHYNLQCQHQFFCSDAFQGRYVSYNIECDPALVILPVVKDIHLIDEIRTAAHVFWLSLTSGECPAATNKDYIDMTDNTELIEKLAEYKSIKAIIEKSEADMDALKKDITQILADKRILAAKCGSNKIQYQTRKGSVNYAAIPELECVNLDKYIKPSTVSWVIR